MAQLLNIGDAPFLLVKLAIGTFAAYTLFRCSHLRLARHGMQLVLTIYIALMFAHLLTGLSALGWSLPATMLTFVGDLPYALASLFS